MPGSPDRALALEGRLPEAAWVAAGPGSHSWQLAGVGMGRGQVMGRGQMLGEGHWVQLRRENSFKYKHTKVWK